jgi:cobalt-precorrin-5B (C1)-methyltransferase
MTPPRANLRTGFTTGACATAATKGALLALLQQRPIAEVTIRLPRGERVTFPLHSCAFAPSEGAASIIKDAGDDPDVTHGAEICARVRWQDIGGVTFRRGPGVGLVTKKGLPVPPGEPAINPVPREMMVNAVAEVLAGAGLSSRGVVVEISIPRGEELALKTYNPRLGIVGGLSILGTTGIVVPYSTDAWLASVVQGIDVAVAQGCGHLVLVVGAQGERTARQLFALPDDAFIQVGPFFGAALRHGAQAGAQRVSLVAMIGKLAKFAAGNESVHSTASGQDFQFLAELAAAAGVSPGLTEPILAANTAQEVAELLDGTEARRFFALLTERAWHFGQRLLDAASRFSEPGLKNSLEVIVVGRAGEILGRYP